MSEHTPGPWEVLEHNWSTTGVYAGRDQLIAGLDISDAAEESRCQLVGEMTANARLIAAAPELLEKLKYAVEVLSAEGYDVADIRAVISKATGSAA